jgi:methyl-accepting chemotaxis protein
LKFIEQLRIGPRIAVGYGLVIALMLLLLAVTLVNLRHVSEANETMLTVQHERMSLAREWRENIATNSQRALAMGLTTDDAIFKRFGELVKGTTVRTSEVQKRYTELETSEEGKRVLAEVGEARKKYLSSRDVMFKARGDAETLSAAAVEFQKALDAYVVVATANIQVQEKNKDLLGARIVSASETTRNAFIGIVTLAIVTAIFTGWRLAASIVTPLKELQATARRIASGDLSQSIHADTHCETGELMAAMGEMQTSLRELVSQVRAASDSIQTASQEVAAGNADLSNRTEQAASNLQTTASSMEEITGTVRNSAQVASQANGLAVSARAVAQRGGAAVTEVVQTMEQINASSRKIGDIIGVIDSIAFQTNILALNAAVEAARAGEQGRGFAVVATEVRGLASRSADAAREIKSLITASLDKVQQGARQVGDAGSTMNEILSSVQRVSDLIGEITVAASEQSSGLDHINTAVAELDRMTQQNAALVEESAAAADSLQQQAVQLTAGVSRFRVA